MSPLDSRFDAADLRTASTPDLLRLLLGRTRARPWLGLPLADLFQLRPFPQPGCREPGPEAPKAPAVLLAAKELLARSLHENLTGTSVIDQPHAARDLVRLRLAHLPHEVFAVALLDAQHHLLDFVILFRGTLQQLTVSHYTNNYLRRQSPSRAQVTTRTLLRSRLRGHGTRTRCRFAAPTYRLAALSTSHAYK